MCDIPVKPEKPDYYHDLGVSESAAAADIKHAFFNLAKRHHPDKKAPGETIDAVEFRQAREAFETLRDENLKAKYDEDYPTLKQEWEMYREELQDPELHRRRARQRNAAEAEAEQQRKAEEEEKRRKDREEYAEKAKQAERWECMEWEAMMHEQWIADRRHPRSNRCPCEGCCRRRKREYEERIQEKQERAHKAHQERLQKKKEEAERRSREAAQKRQEEEQRQAMEKAKEAAEEKKRQEHKRQQPERRQQAKEKRAEQKSKETARRAREEQEKAAQRRMAESHIKAQQDKFLTDLEQRGQKPGEEEVVVDIGWAKKKGVAKCLFCDADIKYYSFCCPDGGAVACNPCKNKLSRFAPPKADGEEQEERQE